MKNASDEDLKSLPTDLLADCNETQATVSFAGEIANYSIMINLYSFFISFISLFFRYLK